VTPNRVVPVWTFTRVQQQSNDLDVIKLRCQRERQVAILTTGTRKKQPARILDTSQSRRYRQINPSAMAEQGVHRLQLAVQCSRVDGTGGIRAAIAKKID
jgi:hypothetical protein